MVLLNWIELKELDKIVVLLSYDMWRFWFKALIWLSLLFYEMQHAIAYVEGDKFYGAKATMNVWEPKIQQPNEFSLSQIWILGGSFGEDLNSIEAGWQVHT